MKQKQIKLTKQQSWYLGNFYKTNWTNIEIKNALNNITDFKKEDKWILTK